VSILLIIIQLIFVKGFYHGVPMVGIPFFGDQFENCMRLEETGAGVKVVN
jgi:UDP:flavonoid glycosyltransferase YjiC (YdhE family)